MIQINYSHLNKSTEKDETDRTITRAFHDQTPEEKRQAIIDAAKAVVTQRYNQVTASDIVELSKIGDAIQNGESRNAARDLIFLLQLANKAILENEKLKSDIIGFTIEPMERHIALDAITKSLSIPDQKATAMARYSY
jgi:hypothetical protein